jgi:hypothetical protein
VFDPHAGRGVSSIITTYGLPVNFEMIIEGVRRPLPVDLANGEKNRNYIRIE